MKSRGMGLAVLVLCVLGGLIAAVFLPAISANLQSPQTPGAGSSISGAPGQSTVSVTKPAPVPSTGATALANGVSMLAQDTFQRPDQALWGTSSGLRPWGGDANTNPAFAIVNHAGQITGGQGALQAILNVTSADSDIFLSGTVSQFADDGTTNLGVVARWQDSNNWYKALIDGSTLQLLKNVNGKVSVLAEHAFKATSGASYSLHLRVLGSSLFARAWPKAQPEPAAWTLMTIDTQFPTGMSGVRVKVVPGVVIRVTSFQETSVSGPM